jgi:hypothetical protein
MPLIDGFPSASGAADQFEIRKDLAALVVRDSNGNPRAGVLYTNGASLLAATATMNVSIAPFPGVSVRSGGPIFNAHEGTDLLLLDTAPASNSRIDVIYYKQTEMASPSSDATNGPVFGFVKGTAAAIPTKPALTVPGAVELGTVTIPSTATALNSSGVVIATTAPYTTGVGGTLPFRTKAERDLFSPVAGQVVLRLDTKTLEVWNGSGYAAIGNSPVRDFYQVTNTAYIGGGTNAGSFAIPAQPYAQRVMFEVNGMVSPQSVGDIGVGVTATAGTLTQTTNTRTYQTIGNQWYGFQKRGWLTLPANTAATINFVTEQSVPGAHNIMCEAHVLAAGEY